MSFWFLWISVGAMLSLTAMQLAYVLLYLRFLKTPVSRSEEPELFSGRDPKVAVILCLRGADPSLAHCLDSLVKIDYPNYQLHLAFDDLEDPAYLVCQRQLGPSDAVFHVSHDRSLNCSLKCSSIIATILELDDSIDVVALVDADAVVEPDWLTRLVKPLKDPTIGATTGNRWFAPTSNAIGPTIRKIWNGAALPQMSLYQIAWGGSLAIRRDVIEQCHLLEHWSVAFCEDTMLSGKLAEHSLKVARVPGLIIVNQESTGLADAIRWIGRQLLTVRLYHRRWPLVLAHAIFGAVCLLGPPLIGLYFLLSFQFVAFTIIFGVWSLSQLINLALIQWIEFANRWWLHQPGQPTRIDDQSSDETEHTNSTAAADSANAVPAVIPPLPLTRDRDLGPLCVTPSGLIAFMVLQFIYPFLALGAAFQLRVRWRGIDYRIQPKGRVEMVEYVRFAEQLDPNHTGSDRSIH